LACRRGGPLRRCGIAHGHIEWWPALGGGRLLLDQPSLLILVNVDVQPGGELVEEGLGESAVQIVCDITTALFLQHSLDNLK
jgi:hypothetical protein